MWDGSSQHSQFLQVWTYCISHHRRVQVQFLAFVEGISEMISVYCKKKIIKRSEINTLVCKWLSLERQDGGLYSGHTFSIG